jgi:hypothetical protein
MPQDISDLQLEQYALGELSGEQADRVRDLIDRDPALRERLSALQESNREILAAYPPERIVPAIIERARQQAAAAARSRAWTRGVLWALPAAAAIVIAFSVGLFRPETRMKGLAPELSVFVQTTSGAQELRPGDAARPGDRVQVSYNPAGAKYAAIVSIDGRGTITWHLPAGYGGGAGSAPAVDAQGRTVLPRSYELDDAPRFERFFLVTGSSPFRLADIQAAVRALVARPAADTSALALPRGLAQASFLLRKQEAAP